MKDFTFGNNIYKLRTDKNLTQEDLASKMGVTDKAVSKWENGSSKPSIENLRKMASIFDISLDELLTVKKGEKDKKIAKIVLTGGPCAGKSTAMNWIQNFFQKQGYAVIFIPETATELITGGIKPGEVRDIVEFQRQLMELQLAKEKIYRDSAVNLPNDKILIVCDRGCLDNKAYMSAREFNYIMKLLDLNEGTLRDSYDAVFHLVTAAKGAEKYYNLDNPARTETPEDAIKLDDSTINAWTGHPHLRIVDNSTDFEEKMKRLLKEISHFLGEPEPYEIERKYLIDYPDLEYLNSLKNCEQTNIVQTYLKSPEGEEIRIRQRGKDGNYTYSETKKVAVSGIKRIELEKRLTQEEYLDKLTKADPRKGQIVKTRYCFTYHNQYFELDIYPFWDDQAILEIELVDENAPVDLPPFIRVKNEVTDNPEYKNAALAKKRLLK